MEEENTRKGIKTRLIDVREKLAKARLNLSHLGYLIVGGSQEENPEKNVDYSYIGIDDLVDCCNSLAISIIDEISELEEELE